MSHLRDFHFLDLHSHLHLYFVFPNILIAIRFIHSQGSNNSDQSSSGYLSGSGGSNSLPPNAHTIDGPSHFDYKYGQARLDNLNDKFQAGQGQQQQHLQQKKLSLTSSLNDYSSSIHNELDMEYNNGHK